MIVSDSVITGMMFALVASFTVPVILLMYIMVKIKPKGLLAFTMSGIISTVFGPVVIGTIIGTMLTSAGIQNGIVNNIITAITLVLGAAVLMKYISPGGINFMQTIVFGVGITIVYAIFYSALEIIQNIMLINYLKSDDVSSIIGDNAAEEIEQWKKVVSELSATEYFVSGYLQILFVIFAVGIVVILFKGIAENKFAKYTLIAMVVYTIKELGCSLLTKYVNSIVAAVFATIFAVAAVFYILNIKKQNIKIMSQAEKARKSDM